MDSIEAANIIETIIASIKDNPSQFHINVNVTGQRVTSHGGTGLSISATGGGAGSTTIGQVVTADGSQIQIAQQKGIRAMNDQLDALINTLSEIAQQLKSATPDKELLSRLHTSLKDTWVPGVIVTVVGSILTKALGL